MAQPWYGVRMSRTKWYNLLVPAERVEAMRVLWGIVGWGMRKTEDV